MSKIIKKTHFFLFSVLIFLLMVTFPGAGSQTAPMTEYPAPGFHPGLFGEVPGKGEIPPAVNTYEADQNTSSNSSLMVSYSFIPANISSGKATSVAGFISGAPGNTRVNITGRAGVTESFMYLATVQSDNRGFFEWVLPEWASGITEVMVGIAR